MAKLLLKIADSTVILSFYLLLFLVPLILTPFNYELFEYNKMMLTYALTVIIVGSWMIKMVLKKEINIKRTPLDLPLLLFLLSQIISTFISIDRHVSIWGYYSRFNGGLISTIAYILLYFAFVSNFPKEKIKSLLFTVLGSGFLVAVYGILEHFGIDKDIWVQDVQNRVFSSLGQPNWLGAYLAVLIPIAIGLLINSNIEYRNSKQIQNSKGQNSKRLGNSDFENSNLFRASDFGLRILPNLGLSAYWIIGLLFYITLLFTKSRSGFIALWVCLSFLIAFRFISFLISNLISKRTSAKTYSIPAAAENNSIGNKFILLSIAVFAGVTFFLGSPFGEINRFTWPELTRPKGQPVPAETKPSGASLIEVGVTESGTIRQIVWKGAIDIFWHYPLFGTGVETFASSYYKFRPVEHNMTSEWDFLYNKAHNEFLNYAATTGAFGLGSYLLIMTAFIWWNLRIIFNFQFSIFNEFSKNQNPKINRQLITYNLQLGLFIAWLSISFTNFFGFSVVIIQLFFFLIPAMSFALTSLQPDHQERQYSTFNIRQKIIVMFIFIVVCYMLYVISTMWYADVLYAKGYHLSNSQDYAASYQSLKKAIVLNRHEPLYFDELSLPAAEIAVALLPNQSTLSAQMKNEAITSSDIAVETSPNNVNFWKTRTRVFYALSALDEKYTAYAASALREAESLSPTDPKIHYNLALIDDKLGQKEESFAELEKTVKLKPDYRDAYFAQALFYERDRKRDKAREALNFILTKLNPNDEEAKKKLEELK